MAIKFNKRLRAKAVVDMAPMIDIVFQLVIFFMVATTFKTTTGMELIIPKAENISTIPETPLKITIIDRDNIIIGNKKVTFSDVSTILASTPASDSGERKSVILFGDKKMEYNLLIDIMDILKSNGYDSLDLAIDKKY
ncbi:MAG: hypothetical protein A2015_11785 [Spirochaetes bacterium GWF1_31_7]|nr:MAG: hypothetical protein A2Y30_15290 [Spirochaetes bacterium GWE1_32_154]OHD49099.1 MAG: hypothetical protein A2015_11785 [Spirochaetes bacterium GWF1_31_7]OHD50315.1 MAG: hypothetical protein A2Y29_13340 [Spirochaetes bacterium GWE2_31_10]OHD77352.1 MAG: hypothetical protein A2355_14260 [Spirochaetes bacterium RIFOXYB1_FULL_32_8]HBD93897.1 hypothetical protein [Spirochaetia bacterium]